MSDITDTIEQVIKAGKGLVAKLKVEGTKQYQELVALGEKTEESSESIAVQLRELVESALKDIKGSRKQVQLASLGLANRVKDESQTMFKSLVELGEVEKVEVTQAKKPSAKTTAKKKPAAKTTNAS